MVKQPECEYLSLDFFKPDLDRVAPGLLRRFIIFQSYDAPAGKLVYGCSSFLLKYTRPSGHY